MSKGFFCALIYLSVNHRGGASSLFCCHTYHTGMGADGFIVDQIPSGTTSESIEALLEAARYDNLDDVISLASSGVSLDSKDSEGRTG
ncbi:hypothetical protein P3S68_031137 [Capsicum galapagoense]